MGYQQQNMAQSIGWFQLFGLYFLVILLGIVDILPMLVKKKWYFPWIYQIFFVYLYSKLRFWLRIALRTIKEFAGEGLRETCYTSSVEKLGQFQPSDLLRVYLKGDEMILRIYATKKGLSNLSYK